MQGLISPAGKVVQSLKFAGVPPKKTTEMAADAQLRQAKILGLLFGGRSIQNRTGVSS